MNESPESDSSEEYKPILREDLSPEEQERLGEWFAARVEAISKSPVLGEERESYTAEVIPSAELERISEDIDGLLEVMEMQGEAGQFPITPDGVGLLTDRQVWGPQEFAQIAEVLAPFFETTGPEILNAHPEGKTPVLVASLGEFHLYVQLSTDPELRDIYIEYEPAA